MSWRVDTSQNCRILFNIRLCWLCMIKKLLETTSYSRLKTSVRRHIDQTNENSIAISGKQQHKFRKETHVVSVMIQRLETDAIRDQKDNRPLLHQQKVQAAEGRAFLEQETTFRDNNPSWNFGHPPVCPNYKSESGCTYGDKCIFRHVEAEEKPSKKSKKSGVLHY